MVVEQGWLWWTIDRMLGRRFAAMAMATTAEKGFIGPVARNIAAKVSQALACDVLEVENQSHHHAGHTGNPTGAADAETHFKLKIVSSAFEGKKLIERHRMVNELLKEELDTSVHALTMDLKPPPKH